MRTVELFCGTKSFSKVAEERGHSTFTLDCNPEFEPDMVCDILGFDPKVLGDDIDCMWLSPPCTCFSVASIGHHWNADKTPKTDGARTALSIVEKCVEIIEAVKPRLWFMENPRGMMRTLPILDGYRRVTVTYCQYGETRMKPTDIWTNTDIQLKPPCRNGDPCHERAPRGARTGTQGIDGARDRAIVPRELIVDVLDYCEEMIEKKEFRQVDRVVQDSFLE